MRNVWNVGVGLDCFSSWLMFPPFTAMSPPRHVCHWHIGGSTLQSFYYQVGDIHLLRQEVESVATLGIPAKPSYVGWPPHISLPHPRKLSFALISGFGALDHRASRRRDNRYICIAPLMTTFSLVQFSPERGARGRTLSPCLEKAFI